MERTLDKLYNLSERERDLFSGALNTLFTSTFILKQVDKDRDYYRYVLANFALFEAYLDFLGWHLRKDETLGVISCAGPLSGKVTLNLEETLSLLVFRLLYEEKRAEVSLSGENLVRQYEFHEKYKVLSERMLNKTRMREILRRFKSLKLIHLRGDETDPETLIVLYPSIVFTLDSESIDNMYGRIEQLKVGGVSDAES